MTEQRKRQRVHNVESREWRSRHTMQGKAHVSQYLHCTVFKRDKFNKEAHNNYKTTKQCKQTTKQPMTDETMLLKHSNTINETNEKCTNAHIAKKKTKQNIINKC